MSQGRALGGALIVGGLVLVALALFAYRLGLSALPTFGWKKLLVAALGAVAIGVGLLMMRVAAADDGAAEDEPDDVAVGR